MRAAVSKDLRFVSLVEFNTLITQIILTGPERQHLMKVKSVGREGSKYYFVFLGLYFPKHFTLSTALSYPALL